MIEAKMESYPVMPDFSESKNLLHDESGYQMELHEMAFGPINLKWGTYCNPSEKVLSFYPEKNTVVSHYRISDPASKGKTVRHGIAQGQFVVYHETPEPYDLLISPTGEKSCEFFEVGVTENSFAKLFTGDDNFLSSFHNHTPAQIPSLDFTASIQPKMHAIINDMYRTSFQGPLRTLFLEAKTIELLLLQIEQLNKQGCVVAPKLKKEDIACLHGIKEHLDLNFNQPTSIAALSRKAGINSMKLKTGFKQLFHTTVFGYLHTLRMREAKRLLTDGNISVGEVADRVGYKYAHHFTAAFKKEFNVTPRQLLR